MQSTCSPCFFFFLAACFNKGIVSTPAPKYAQNSPQELRDSASKQGLELQEFDLNRDGKTDLFKTLRQVSNGQDTPRLQLVQKDLDINFDGKVDIRQIFDDKSVMIQELADFDFDGRFDKIDFLVGGQLVRKEMDLNFDNKPDVIKYYEQNQLMRVESDTTGDGQVDTWEYYEKGQLDRVGIDTNFDGKIDEWKRKDEIATPQKK